MRKRDIAVVIVLLLPMLGGCAAAGRLMRGTPTLADIEDLREQQQYARALERLERLRGSLPDSVDTTPYEELEARIRREGESFAREAVRGAQQRERAGDWQGASESLAEAHRRYPDSDSLVVSEAALSSRRTEEAVEVDEWLSLVRARGLLAELPLREELARIRFDDRATRRRLADLQRELSDLHRVLVQAAERALALEDTDAARDYLETAARIERTELVEAVLDKIRQEETARLLAEQPEDPPPASGAQDQQGQQSQQQQQQQQRTPPPVDPEAAARRARERAAQARLARLMEDARDALLQGELLRARERVAIAKQVTPEGSEELLQLEKEVSDRIDAEVSRLDASARTEYVEGHFEQAAESWRRALELAPDSAEIKQQYDRVQRVLENLRRLRGDPPPPIPPVPVGREGGASVPNGTYALSSD